MRAAIDEYREQELKPDVSDRLSYRAVADKHDVSKSTLQCLVNGGISISDLLGPAWPKSPGFGSAQGGFGFLKVWAKPKPANTAWPWPGLGPSHGFGEKINII